MTRTTKTRAAGWVLLVFGLCGGCDDEICVGGSGESGDCIPDADAGGDGDADGDGDGDGDADRYAAIAAAYEAERALNGVPGLQVAIVENGELAWTLELGNKGPDSDEPVGANTQFRFLSSAFPAIALLQLVDAGLVERSERVSTYVPGFTLSEGGHWLEAEQSSLVESITIDDLLEGKSGMELGNFEPSDWKDHSDSVLGDYLTSPEFAETHHLVAAPGELPIGSELGVVLMGLVVENVTEAGGRREFFPDYVRDHIFVPLGMTHSMYRAEEVVAGGDFATPSPGPADQDQDNPWMRPSYGLWSTATDVARFAEFLLNGNETVLPQALLAEALSARDQPGWGGDQGNLMQLKATEGPCVLGGTCPAVGDPQLSLQSYFNGGWFAWLEVVPSRDFAAVYLSNGASPFPAADQLAMTQLLDFPPLVPDYPGDDHDPGVYVSRYLLDNGGTTRIYPEEDGTLHLSSPACDLEPRSPGYFRCDAPRGEHSVSFLFDPDGDVQYLVVGGNYVAVPDPSDVQ